MINFRFKLALLSSLFILIGVACSSKENNDPAPQGPEKTVNGMTKVKTVKLYDKDVPEEYYTLTFTYEGDKIISFTQSDHEIENGNPSDHTTTIQVTYPSVDQVVMQHNIGDTPGSAETVYTYLLKDNKIMSATVEDGLKGDESYTFRYTNGMLSQVNNVNSTSPRPIYQAIYSNGSKNPDQIQLYKKFDFKYNTKLNNLYSIDINTLIYYSAFDIENIILFAAFARLLPNSSNIISAIDNDTSLTASENKELINSLTLQYIDSNTTGQDESYTTIIEIGY